MKSGIKLIVSLVFCMATLSCGNDVDGRLSYPEADVCASGRIVYPVAGTYMGEPAQGMAVWEDRAFLLSNTGLCRVMDLRTGGVIAEFPLGSAAPGNHANSASFGIKTPAGHEIPALYVAECAGECRCFVESISPSSDSREGMSSRLIQTIKVIVGGSFLPVATWVVDRKGGFLYGIARRHADPADGYFDWDRPGPRVNVITKLRLPSLDEGSEVTLTEADILDRFEIESPSVIQGAAIIGRRLYIVSGLSESQSDRFDARRILQIVNLRRRSLSCTVDLTTVTHDEPEDIDFCSTRFIPVSALTGCARPACFRCRLRALFHHRVPLLYCAQTGGLYTFPLR